MVFLHTTPFTLWNFERPKVLWKILDCTFKPLFFSPLCSPEVIAATLVGILQEEEDAEEDAAPMRRVPAMGRGKKGVHSMLDLKGLIRASPMVNVIVIIGDDNITDGIVI